jgi:hypothetical protein
MTTTPEALDDKLAGRGGKILASRVEFHFTCQRKVKKRFNIPQASNRELTQMSMRQSRLDVILIAPTVASPRLSLPGRSPSRAAEG